MQPDGCTPRLQGGTGYARRKAAKVTGAGEGRGRSSTWPRRARVLAAAGGALIAIATAVTVHATAARPPRYFPGQYVFSGDYGHYDLPTTVSISQAFHDHWLIPPAAIRDLRYAADSPSYAYPYPFDAVFTFPCSEISGFVKASHLQYGGTAPWPWGPNQDLDVSIFAQAQGWNPADRTTRWYYLAIPETGDQWEQLIITGRTACTAYLTDD
jgi:hypothetical protein